MVLTFAFWLIEKRKTKLYLIAHPFKNSIIGVGIGLAWLGSVGSFSGHRSSLHLQCTTLTFFVGACATLLISSSTGSVGRSSCNCLVRRVFKALMTIFLSYLSSAIVVILMVLGVMRILEYNAVSMIGVWLFSAFINTIMQELLVRGYLYQMIKTNYNVVIAVVITTALFTFMHGGAFEAGIIPVLNVLTMSLLMSVILEYTQSLIAPIITHFIWNGVGAIVLGDVSLAEDYPHLLTSEFVGNVLLTGGTAKIEGSFVVFIANAILILIFLLLIKKRSRYRPQLRFHRHDGLPGRYAHRQRRNP